MKHFRDETNRGRFVGILFSEYERQFECAIFEWCVVRSITVYINERVKTSIRKTKNIEILFLGVKFRKLKPQIDKHIIIKILSRFVIRTNFLCLSLKFS